MKNLLILFIVLATLFPSCDKKEESFTYETATIDPETKHSYNEITDKKINWNDVFFPQKGHYFVYFYSLTCSHCNELKNDIIEYALNHDDIYFVQDSEDIVIDKNIASTIGINDVKNLCIKGFPSIIEIDKKILVKNVVGISDIVSLLNL